MKISKKQRGWILGAALLLTVAATASVNKQDDGDIAVVRHERSKAGELQQKSGRLAVAEPDNLVEKLKRPALPETVKDMFPPKSWYVPPPPPPPGISVRPSAPPLSFHYIGKMLDGDSHAAVFLERQSRIFVVREGDAIDGNYRVDAIAPPVMTLTYMPLDEKQTMQIGEVN